MRSSHHLNQRRLSRPIFPKQRMNLPSMQIKGNPPKRANGSE